MSSAGIYYAPGSVKAELCVRGKHLLYDYMESRGVPYSQMGKLIVATSDDQMPALEQIRQRAAENGVPDLDWLTPAQVKAMEPAVESVGALISPSTGILDSHAYMLALQGEAEDHGAMLAFHTPVLSGRVRGPGRNGGGFEIETGGDSPMALSCDILVIYPAPEQAGLGVHVTLDLGGQCRFGPDVEWIDAVNYDVDPGRAEKFYAAVRKYWPGLPDGSLQPGYAGIRPKIQAPGEPAKDFMIQGPRDHGIANHVALYGIESPGVTSSLAIAEKVMALLNEAA